MLRSSEIRIPRNTAARSVAARLVVLLLLGVFSFQLARPFILIETCTHHGTSGYTLEHCKDSLDGLIPFLQLGGIPPSAPQETLDAAWERLPPEAAPKLYPLVSSFFHPPKTLS